MNDQLTKNPESHASSEIESSKDLGTDSHESSHPKSRLAPFKWTILAVVAVFVVLAVWIASVAISRSRDEAPIDPDRLQSIEITENESSESGISAWIAEDGQLVEDAPFVVQFLYEFPEGDGQHRLDPLLGLAEAALQKMRAEIRDYRATIIKQERVGGSLQDENYIECKVRQSSLDSSNDSDTGKPFGVYLRFLEPASARGREVIWVKGENNDRLIAHEGGLKNLLTVRLKPSSPLAMMGNRYPITDIGIENLLVRFVEIGNEIKTAGDCEVHLRHDVLINERPCTKIEIAQLEKRAGQKFFRAEIYIDHEHSVPIRYTAFDWPEKDGDEPPLIETYTYADLEVNVGITDADFDPENEAYRYH